MAREVLFVGDMYKCQVEDVLTANGYNITCLGKDPDPDEVMRTLDATGAKIAIITESEDLCEKDLNGYMFLNYFLQDSGVFTIGLTCDENQNHAIEAHMSITDSLGSRALLSVLWYMNEYVVAA